METNPPRKLAVILHADVVDSTALVRLNEAVAHQRIRDAFRRLSETVTEHDGIAREVRGDALVAEFSKASDAVSASIAFQATNTAHNEDLPDEARPVVRVGIAMGEVIVADETVTGEGVVLAQRLEQLAEPGGVCIQDAVYQTVPKRFPFTYENLGEHHLKGFDEPIRAYAAKEGNGQARKLGPDVSASGKTTSMKLADQPSIVVLPFRNLSSDREQDYFCDGLTEEVITSLSRYRELVVTAVGSSFQLKGQTDEPTGIAQKLGVRFLLEGSIRKAGDRIRVTVQLVDGASGARLWAERYNRTLTGIFEVQDDVTQTIVGTLAGRLEEASQKAALRRPNTDLNVYDLLLRAKHFLRDWKVTKADIFRARDLYEEAVRREPEFSAAYTGLAETYHEEYLSSWTNQRELAGRRAIEFARKALSLDELDSHAHTVLAMAYKHHDSNHERAFSEIEKAIQANPNEYWTYCMKSGLCVASGNLDEGLAAAYEALRRNPLLPDACRRIAGLAHYLAGRYEVAIENFRNQVDAGSESEAYIAACYAQLGRMAEAGKTASSFRELNDAERIIESEADPKSWHLYWSRVMCVRDPAIFEPLVDGLRAAGIVK